jgi:hypothetical protein
MVNLVKDNPTRLAALQSNPLPELQKLEDDAINSTPKAYTGDVLL